MQEQSSIERWEALGQAGLIVSICYGPSDICESKWTVQVLHPRTREEFHAPFAADNFPSIIEIAETECVRRGWIVMRRHWELRTTALIEDLSVSGT